MARYRRNPQVQAVNPPPIAEVEGWVEHRRFSTDRPLLDVAQAVPSYTPAEQLRDDLARRLRDPATSRYTDILGLHELRAAMAAHIARDYEAQVDAEQVAITSGCNQAFCVVMDALAKPGDEAVLLLPYYFNHHMWLRMRGIGARCIPFDETGPPRIDDIRACISAATRAIVLVTPNNPTGREYTPAFLADALELAVENGVALVIDETYKDFRSRSGPPHPLLSQSRWADNLVQLFSFSKSYALTGYRVGAIVADRSLIREIAKILDNLAICPPHPGQLAALFALNHLDEWRRRKADMLRERVETLRALFNNEALEYRLVSSGAYFAYVRHPFGGEPARAVARRLADDFNILCLPGSMFGPTQEPYLRFAFANLDAGHIPSLVQRLIDSQ